MLESPKLGKNCSERVDQNEYELTKMSTSWPDNEYELTNWERIDQNHEYELTKMRTSWLEYELTWVRVDSEPFDTRFNIKYLFIIIKMSVCYIIVFLCS